MSEVFWCCLFAYCGLINEPAPERAGSLLRSGNQAGLLDFLAD